MLLIVKINIKIICKNSIFRFKYTEVKLIFLNNIIINELLIKNLLDNFINYIILIILISILIIILK